MIVTRDTLVEDLLDRPGVITSCIRHGFSPYVCSGSYPSSIGRLLEARDVPDPDGFLAGLSAFLEENDKS